MKKIGIIGLFIFLTFISSEIAFSQAIWTLDQCIKYAWENNFSIQNQDLGVKIREADYRQSKYDILPSLNAQSSFNQYFGRSIDPSSNNYVDVKFFYNSYGAYSSVDIFNGFVKLNTIGMQRYNLLAEKNKLQQVKNQIAFTVINSYFDVLLKNGLFTIAKENFQLSRTQLDYTIKFVEVGRKPETDVLETEANLAADSFLLVQSNNMMEQAFLDLKYQMNLPLEKSLNIDTLIISIFSGTLDSLTTNELFRKASITLPELDIAKNQLMAAKKAVQISKGAFSPYISLSAGWNSQYTETNRDLNDRIIPFSDQMSNNSNEFIAFGIGIPIFSKFSKYTQLKKSKLQYQQAKLQYDDETYKLMMSVNKSLTDWKAARAEYESSLKQLQQNQKAYEAAEKKLDKGLINIIEFSVQKNKWFRAKTETLRTGLQVLLKERYIRFLMTGSLI